MRGPLNLLGTPAPRSGPAFGAQGDAALEELLAAEARAPTDLEVALALGSRLIRAGQPAAARERFQKVLHGEPAHVAAHYGLGVALTLLRDLDGARRAFEQAAALDPTHAPSLGALAFALYRDGEHERARELAEQAVARMPHLPDAVTVLARLAAAGRDHAALKQRAEALLARADIGGETRASAWLLLADALDGEGDHVRAFEAYQTGKAEFRRLHAPHFAGGVGALEASERALSRFAAAPAAPAVVRPAPESEHGPGPDAPRRHVFLTGFARSGTTLLEQVLGAHPEVEDLEEMPTLEELQHLFLATEDGPDRLTGLDDKAWAALRADYWARVRRFGAEPLGKVFLDKQPLATVLWPALAALFPEARVLFAVRDPRDVVLSCFRRGFKINPATFEFTDLERTARLYDASMRMAWLVRERGLIEAHEVRYERLVDDFEGEVRSACAFLGLDWRDELHGFAERARTRRIKTASAAQVTRGLYSGAAGGWRPYRQAMASVLPILQPWVERFGYPAD